VEHVERLLNAKRDARTAPDTVRLVKGAPRAAYNLAIRRRTLLPGQNPAAVAVTAAALGACVYLYWRHRQEQEYARLSDPEPQRPDPELVASPGGESQEPVQPSGAPPSPAVDEQAREPAVSSALHEPAVSSALHEPAAAGEPAAVSETAAPARAKALYEAPAPVRRVQRAQGRAGGHGSALPAAPTFLAPQRRAGLPSTRPVLPLSP
jgi:hypothetical protein